MDRSALTAGSEKPEGVPDALLDPVGPDALREPDAPVRGRGLPVVGWVLLAVLVVVVSVVAALRVAGDAASPASPVSPSSTGAATAAPTPGRTGESTEPTEATQPIEPTDEPGPVNLPTASPLPTDPDGWVALGFLPDVAVHEFVVDQVVVDEGMVVDVGGIRISGLTSTGPDTAGYLVEGDGFSPIVVNAQVGTVVEVPGWGRIALVQVEWLDTGGRPDLAFRFAAQTEHPLQVVAVEP